MIFFEIENCLITPSFTFAQFFQLQGHGQYGMHINILNILTDLNLGQNVLFQMLCDDYLI